MSLFIGTKPTGTFCEDILLFGDRRSFEGRLRADSVWRYSDRIWRQFDRVCRLRWHFVDSCISAYWQVDFGRWLLKTTRQKLISLVVDGVGMPIKITAIWSPDLLSDYQASDFFLLKSSLWHLLGKVRKTLILASGLQDSQTDFRLNPSLSMR